MTADEQTKGIPLFDHRYRRGAIIVPTKEPIVTDDQTKGIPYTIAADFDGCICDYDFPRCGAPRKDVIGLLRYLVEQHGWRVIIHSCRVNPQWDRVDRLEHTLAMLVYLSEHRVPFHAVWGVGWGEEKRAWRDDPYAPVGQDWRWRRDVGKPVAHVYCDDRGINPVHPTYRGALLDMCLSIAKHAERTYREGLEKDSEQDEES